MSSEDALAYEGDFDPEDLPEPVIFKSVPFFGCCVGLAVGMCVLMILGTVVMSYASVIDPGSSPHFLPLLILSGVAALITIVWTTWNDFGKKVIISRQGVAMLRRGQSIQDCPWGEMTVKVSGRGWRRRIIPCDQFGKPFSTTGMDSSHPDRILATKALRSRAKTLAEALTPPEKPRNSKRSWLIAPAVGVGVAGLAFSRSAISRFVELAGDPSAAPLDRTAALGLVILCGLAAYSLMFWVQMLQIPLLIWAKKSTRKQNPILREFVAERKGLLEAASLDEGVWYRYVAPQELKYVESKFWGGILCLALISILVFGLGLPELLARPQDADYVVPVLGTCLAFFGGFAIWAIQHGLRLHRAFRSEFRKLGDQFEVKPEKGVSVLYVKCRSSKRSRSSMTTVGGVWWLLRSKTGKTILIDPRYLVPVVHPNPATIEESTDRDAGAA